MEATKKATRDYPSFSQSPWGLWDVLYARRSHRKYLPLKPDEGFMGVLNETVRLAITTREAEQGSILVVCEDDRVEEIRKKCKKGMEGKINLWLARTSLCGFLVLALPGSDLKSDRPQKLPHTAMAAEDIILWLSEEGLGTCWLGGFHQGEVKEILGLQKEIGVPAIITLGKPKRKIKAMDYDNLVYRRLSRHRKPLPEIAYLENMRRHYILEDMSAKTFAASSTQDIRGLLRKLGGDDPGEGDVPLELALEACLEAARVAPSAGNAQQWRFVVVTGDKTRELATACETPHAWRAAIVGAGFPGGMQGFSERSFWMLDLPIAFSHMSLMAVSMDLAVDLQVEGFDAEKVNALAGLEPELSAVGVMGIR
jgi:nitroreductase